MNKEKISDFVDVWAETVGLKEDRYINVIKNDILKRCAMYENEISTISTKDDSCDSYIIKPINDSYCLEDFFLNRLMLGLREVDFSGALEGNGGDYTAYTKALNVNVGMLNSRISEKATRHKGLQNKNIQIIKKTIEHELGHCFKSAFTNGYKSPLGGNRTQDTIYENLINNLKNYKNGKYANQIKTVKELNSIEYSEAIKTGVHDSKNNYNHDFRVQWIDEMLNEAEALELTNSNDVHETWPLQNDQRKDSPSGNYVNVYNYISGYSTFTGYGNIFKAILGKKDSFTAEYISSVDIFKEFDKEYADIVKEVWGLDNCSPIQAMFLDFNDLLNKKQFNENIMLKLDEFFAKCYQKKIDKIITQNNGNIDKSFEKSVLKDIENFQSRLTTNDDPQKRELLAHNVVFNDIKSRVKELSKSNDEIVTSYESKNKQEETSIEIKQDDLQPNITEENLNVKLPQNKHENKMKWIKKFIEMYEKTESELQYETRSKMENDNMQRVLEGIELGIFRGNMSVDLDGKLYKDVGEEEFKKQYSIKQLAAMARLLKAADNLTVEGGKNYLEEFSNIPDINYILLEMKKSEATKEMFEMAEENEKNGTIPKYKKTRAQIDKEYAQDYLKSGNLKLGSVEKEIEGRKYLAEHDSIIISEEQDIKDVPVIRKQQVSLTRVLARQQGKVPSKALYNENKKYWYCLMDENSIQLPDNPDEGPKKKITRTKIQNDTQNIGMSEINNLMQEIKKNELNREMKHGIRR